MTVNVLAVASEIFPLAKTGGLADVTGALPGALASRGVATRTLVPGYREIRTQYGKAKTVRRYADLFGGDAAVQEVRLSGLDIFVLDAPHLFDRPGGLYGDASGKDWPDNWRRFAALSKVGADLAEGAVPDFSPDIVHVHDWQAALTLAYMRYGAKPAKPSVITVHNLAFQGQFGADVFSGLGLPLHAMALDGVEYYGGVGFLKAGLLAASAITTVSPTYAQEIRRPEFGMGLDGLINTRSGDLFGIVNGIDTEIWNPAADGHLAASYSAGGLDARAANRSRIEQRFGLAGDGSLLVCIVSRLTWQKGMDILAAAIEPIIATGAKLAVLGSGDRALEDALLVAAGRNPGRLGVVVGYDEALSHLLQGGADAIVIPSRFEPCGLTQLYGLRYGCVPMVARTGGLADTVIDANEAALAAGVATGFQFMPGHADDLVHAFRRAVEAHGDKTAWRAMQVQGMKADVSWTRSAERYAELYKSLLSRKAA